MTSYPYWISPSDLGTVADGYSFTAAAVSLQFSDTENKACTSTLLNGTLPPGVSWMQLNNSIKLSGQISVVASSSYEWTFRINNGQFSTDRTFKISVEKTSAEFDWITSNSQPLGYVFSEDITQFQIQAESDPVGAITYSLANLAAIPQGISIGSNTGKISVDLGWKPNTSYQAARDRVYNQGILYQCAISGVSSNSQGPRGYGFYIVDSSYENWQAGRFYSINSVVTNDFGKIYLCIAQGTSSTGGGPTGTGGNIADGSAEWRYLTQSPVWNSYPPDVGFSVVLNAVATLGLQSISRSFSFNVLARPYPPVWLTQSGVIASVPNQINFSFQLEAFDPDGKALIWSSNNLPPWLNLSNVGLLWGNTPFVVNKTLFTFEVAVGDGTSTSTRSFSIEITETVEELYWQTDSNLGTIKDGQACGLEIVAVSVRPGVLLRYGLSGGMLPPNVLIDNDTGAIQGFVEYHAQPKTYRFEVSVTDGVETLVKEFSFLVAPQNLGFFYTISVPLLGNQRFDLVSSNNASVVDDQYLYLANDQGWGRVQRPQVVIASGIRRINQQSLREYLQNYLHNFRMSLQTYTVLPVDDAPYHLVSLAVRDSDSLQKWQPYTNYLRAQRITNPEGLRYVVLVAGISGDTAPSGTGNQIADGSVVWAFDSVPDSAVSRNYPLPWYPYHYYSLGSTIVNNGMIYKSLTSGYSSGNFGPAGQNPFITDNQVVWSYQSTAVAGGNNYWPADVYNLRQAIIAKAGWSTAWGSGASAVPTVDTVTGAITSVTVVSPGIDYWASPVANAQGGGRGAKFKTKVGIQAAQVIYSDSGFQTGETVAVDLDNSTNQALIEITQVDEIGRVLKLSVIDDGSFDHIPSINYWLVKNTKRIKVQFSAGVVAVAVVSGGVGYDSSSTINFVGKEFDPVGRQLIDTFQLQMPLAFASNNQIESLKSYLASANNPFSGQILPVTCVEVSVEGIQWQGYTRFDTNDCSFDCDTTRLVDFDPASETIQDQGATYWDDRSLSFDRNIPIVWPDYSGTVFDNNTTIYDYYATLIDGRGPVYKSRYSSTRLWYFGKPFDV